MVSRAGKQTDQANQAQPEVKKSVRKPVVSGAAARSKSGEKMGGRPKGSPNKISTELRELVLEAMTLAGDPNKGGTDGALKYLITRAKKNPVAFLALINKLLPSKVEAELKVDTTYVISTGVPEGDDDGE